MIVSWFAVVIAVASAASFSAADSASTGPATVPSLSNRVDGLIQQLDNPDPAIRADAHKQLISIGDAARPQLMQAAAGDDPQTSEASREVLQALPWYELSDPPMVIDLLRNYGNGTVTARIATIGRLGELVIEQHVLMRLLKRESNQDVCWRIVAELRKNPQPDTIADMRQLDSATSGSASHFLSGAAWFTPLPNATPLMDQARGRQLFARAIDMELATPSYDDGQLDEAFDELASEAVYHDQLPEASRLRREQSRRVGINRDAFPSPFYSLLALYAQGGPLAELKYDLQTFDRFLFRPESYGTLSRIYRRAGMEMMDATLEQCALDAALTPETDFLSGECFDRLGYSDCSAAQFRSLLSRKTADDDPWSVQARLHLSHLAAVREDDALALDQLQLLLDDRKSSDLTGMTIDELQTMATVHQLKIAETTNDRESMERCLSTLSLDKATDTDTCIVVDPVLQKLGHSSEAAKVFELTYQPLKAQIDQGNTDASLLNEAAWLCARCNMHLDQAMTWARQAVQARPASSAFIDTNAEVCFRAGKAVEAASLERRALQIDPGDLFMRGQLRRFTAAATQQASSPSASSQPVLLQEASSQPASLRQTSPQPAAPSVPAEPR